MMESMKFRIRNLPIRYKIFSGILLCSLVVVILITILALNTSLQPLHEARTESDMLKLSFVQDRLEASLTEWMNHCYALEVDPETKAALIEWCTSDEELTYQHKRLFLSRLENILSTQPMINGFSLFHLRQGVNLQVRRTGERTIRTGNALDAWNSRRTQLQTNFALLPGDGELLLFHQINRFEDNLPLAVLVMHIHEGLFLRNLAEAIELTDGELLLLNDEGLILTQYASGNLPIDQQVINEWLAQDQLPALYKGHSISSAPVSRGKMQILQCISNAEITALAEHTVINGLLMASVALVLAALVAAFLSRVISRPIVNLAGRMQETTILNFHQHPSSKRVDEIGLLERSYSDMMTHNQQLVEQNFQSKIARRNAQLHTLQAQINPHFMYNTLQVIGAISLEEGSPSIYPLTTALSDIMRYAISFGKEMVTLESELKYLDSYLMIQNTRFDNRLQFECCVEESLMQMLLPKLILQPVIENCFAHGLENKEGPWHIRLTAREMPDRILLCIEDNGIGITPEALEALQQKLALDVTETLGQKAHIGLINVHARLRLRWGALGGIQIENGKQEGVRVTLSIGKEQAL